MNNCIVEPIVKNLVKTINILRGTPRICEVSFSFPSPNKTIVEQVANELKNKGYNPTILYGGPGVDTDVPFKLQIPID